MPRNTLELARMFATAGLCIGLALPVLAATDDRPLPPARALTIGLDDAVATVKSRFPSATILESEVARHGSHWVYLIRTGRGSTVRTLKFDTSTGQTIVNKRETVSGQRLQRVRNEIRRLSVAATTKLAAIQAAEAAVPGAKAYQVELDDLNDVPVYKVSLLDGTRRVVVIVTAAEGVVVPMLSDGVVNLSIDDSVAKAESLFSGWSTLKVELEDDRDFDDSGSFYNIRLVDSAGTQRRDIRLNANSGALVRDRTSTVNGGNVNEFRQIAAANPPPAVSFGKAAMVAADSVPGSRVHEVELDLESSGLVYSVELIKSDGTTTRVRVNSATGQLASPATTPTPAPTPVGTPITSAQAAAIAVSRVPGTTVREITLDAEDVGQVYEVKLISANGARTDVHVAVATGAITRVTNKN